MRLPRWLPDVADAPRPPREPIVSCGYCHADGFVGVYPVWALCPACAGSGLAVRDGWRSALPLRRAA